LLSPASNKEHESWHHAPAIPHCSSTEIQREQEAGTIPSPPFFSPTAPPQQFNASREAGTIPSPPFFSPTAPQQFNVSKEAGTIPSPPFFSPTAPPQKFNVSREAGMGFELRPGHGLDVTTL
jgi:hypothetical protein